MRLNRNLAIVAGVLLVVSVLIYRSGTDTEPRFERGQKLVPNLDLDAVTEIQLTSGAEGVTLKREDDGFVVANEHGYPAANQAVNRVLRRLVDLELEKEVGRGEELFAELGLDPEAEEAVEVVLTGASGATAVHLVVGEAFEDGDGSYLRRLDREDAPAYLSSRRLSFDTDPARFLDTEILSVEADRVARIEGPDFVVERDEAGLELTTLRSGQEADRAAVSRLGGVLAFLRFEAVFLADDEQVAGLEFGEPLDFRLTDGSGYRLAVSERAGEHFLQVAGYHTVDRVTVDREESEEELAGKAEILSRADEIARFNRFHGSWVYRVNPSTAETLTMAREDLVK